MWGPDGEEADTLAVIPDSSYAGDLPGRDRRLPEPTARSTRPRWARSPTSGLMAKAAEEYGSHDKTFEAPRPAPSGSSPPPATCCSSTTSQPGDIWRACQTKDASIRDWVKLAVTRARASGTPAVFWLDETRAHDANLIAKVNAVPAGARHRRAHDRDHGAGRGDDVLPGADPQGRGHHLGHRQRAARLQHRPVPDPRARHVGQDALDRAADERRRPVRDRRRRLGPQARPAAGQGELPALGQPGRVLRAGRVVRAPRRARRTTPARRCSPTPSTAPPARSSSEDKSPTRKLGGIDNRGSHFYLALYWAQELAKQTDDAELAAAFGDARGDAGRAGGDDRRRAHRGPGRARPTSAATTAPTTTRRRR